MPEILFIPTSITIAPGFTKSAVTRIGLPIAAMNTGGTPDIITHDVTGLVGGDRGRLRRGRGLRDHGRRRDRGHAAPARTRRHRDALGRHPPELHDLLRQRGRVRQRQPRDRSVPRGRPPASTHQGAECEDGPAHRGDHDHREDPSHAHWPPPTIVMSPEDVWRTTGALPPRITPDTLRREMVFICMG